MSTLRQNPSCAAVGSAAARAKARSSASCPRVTDFVFAVAGEEFGVVLCLILVALFAFIVIRSLIKAMRTEDAFARFAAAGLAMLFGLQSTINMAVNLHLIPAKGMTLPFISYGGSSLISLAYGMGMLVALTRDRPRGQLPGSIVLGRSAA